MLGGVVIICHEEKEQYTQYYVTMSPLGVPNVQSIASILMAVYQTFLAGRNSAALVFRYILLYKQQQQPPGTVSLQVFK